MKIFMKRTFDFCVATVAIMVLLIPLLVISLIIRATSKGSAIFVQKRVGKNGKVFKMYKFRTMYIETPKYLATAEIDDPDKYITKMGKILRRFSLDELPQIINIFKGDMSLIGPRPLIPEETDVHEMRKIVFAHIKMLLIFFIKRLAFPREKDYHNQNTWKRTFYSE